MLEIENGTHQLLVFADDVNTLCGNVHTIMKNTEASRVVSNENGREVNADKTKCTVMSGDQNIGRNNRIKTDNLSFEIVEHLKYFGTKLTNQILLRLKLRAD